MNTVKYAIKKDMGCHIDEPCWSVTDTNLTICEAVKIYRDELSLDVEIIVCNIHELGCK